MYHQHHTLKRRGKTICSPVVVSCCFSCLLLGCWIVLVFSILSEVSMAYFSLELLTEVAEMPLPVWVISMSGSVVRARARVVCVCVCARARVCVCVCVFIPLVHGWICYCTRLGLLYITLWYVRCTIHSHNNNNITIIMIMMLITIIIIQTIIIIIIIIIQTLCNYARKTYTLCKNILIGDIA